MCGARNATVALAGYRGDGGSARQAWGAVGRVAGCTGGVPPPWEGTGDARLRFASPHPYGNCTYRHKFGSPGWAGLIDVDGDVDPLLASVPDEVGDVLRFDLPRADRVLGPYFAVAGALVRVSKDVLVVLGNPADRLTAGTSSDDLRQLAERLNARVDEVSPAKRLGDELEVLHAVRAVTTGTARVLPGTSRHVLDVAVEALSCEVGVLRDGVGNLVATRSWQGVDWQHPSVVAALDDLQARSATGLVCIQNATDDAVATTLSGDLDLRSMLAVAIPAPVNGVLVVAHTSAGPRGFTSLCQQLGDHVCDAASVVLHTAALRDALAVFADEQADAARRDCLTGLGNRLAWDEALVVAQQRVDDGDDVTVITLDIDGLKPVNDQWGHAAGDELLVRCAEVLRQHTDEGDMAFRLGGDEFALLPAAPSTAEQTVRSLAAALDGVTSDLHHVTASVGSATASVGSATAGAGGRVADAARDADGAMYAVERARRPRPGADS